MIGVGRRGVDPDMDSDFARQSGHGLPDVPWGHVCKPVDVSTKILTTWILFTDGACENVASVGGVLICPMGRAVAMFGDKLPIEFERFFYRESSHPIYEVELLPLLISIVLSGSLVDKAQFVCYLNSMQPEQGSSEGPEVPSLLMGSLNCFARLKPCCN